MNIETVKKSKSKISTNFINDAILEYIRKSNYPKKLILNKINSQYEYKQRLNKNIDKENDKLLHTQELMEKDINTLKTRNSKYIQKIINSLSK